MVGSGWVVGAMGISRKEIRERHQDARRAKTALQGVMLLEGPLQRIERAVRRGERFNRGDGTAFGLHRERQAGAHRNPVEQHRAGAAHAMLAADMGAGRPDDMAQKVGEQHPRLGFARGAAAVELERDAHTLVPLHAAHRSASSTTVGPNRRRMSRRSAAVA
jgi:hypothetical protein